MSLPHLNYGRTPVRVCDRCHKFRAEQLQTLKTGVMVKYYAQETHGLRSKIMHMKLSFQDEDQLRLSWRSLDRVVETTSIDFRTINGITSGSANSAFASHTLPSTETGTCLHFSFGVSCSAGFVFLAQELTLSSFSDLRSDR
jgi:hypothetical protein